MQPHAAEAAKRPAAGAARSVVAGLEGGHVRSRHPREERHFEVIAGKVIDAHSSFGSVGSAIACSAAMVSDGIPERIAAPCDRINAEHDRAWLRHGRDAPKGN